MPVIALNVSPDGGLFGSIPYSTVGGDDTVTEPFQSTDGLGCIAGYDDGNDVVFQLNIPAPIAGMTITTTGRTGSFQTLFLRQGPTCSDAETASGAGHSVACDAYSPYTFGALAAGTYFLWVEGDGNGIIIVSVP